MTLTGRRVLVTGSSEGLGKAVAAECLRQGASVMLCARRPDALDATVAELVPQAQPGQQVAGRAADVSQPDEVSDLVEATVSTLGGVDGVVNNASIQGPVGSVEDVAWEAWRSTVEVDLFGPVLVCRAVVPHLRRQGHGKIVNISGGGATAPRPAFSAYASAKAAMVRFSETLAHELAGTGVDVNAVAPGLLGTRMLAEALAAGKVAGDESFRARATEALERPEVNLARAAGLCTWLLSDASDGITGRLLSSVWDPWPALDRWRHELAGTDVYTLRRIVPEDRGLRWHKP